MEAIKEKEIEITEPPKIPEAVQALIDKLEMKPFHAEMVFGGLEVEKVEATVTKLTAKKGKLVVDDEGDTAGMLAADTLRKEAKATRCELEKNRKDLKEIPKKQGQLIDGIANHYKGLIEPLEDYFEAQATFAKRQQEKRTNELIAKRKALLENEGMSTAFIELGSMPEEEFVALHTSAIEERKRREAKAEQEKKLANERTDLLRAEGVDTRYLPLGTMEEAEFQNRLAAAKQAKIDKAEADRKAQEAKAEADRLKAEKAKADAEAKAKQKAEDDLHYSRFIDLCGSGFTSDDIGEGVHLGRMNEIDFEQFQIQITARRDEALKLKRQAEEAKAEQARLEAEILAKRQKEEAEAKAKAEEARKLAEGPEVERVRAFAKTLRAVAESAPVLRAERLTKEVDDAVQSINEAAENLEALCNA